MDSVYSPLQVTLGDGITCRMMACGFGHAAAVTTEGHLFTWGWGTDGCLGQVCVCVWLPWTGAHLVAPLKKKWREK